MELTANLLGLSVNGKSVEIATGNEAISVIDTGTTLIGGPSEGVQNLYAAIPGSQPFSQMEGFFTFRKLSLRRIQRNSAFRLQYYGISL